MAKSPLRTKRETYAAEFTPADYDRAYFTKDPVVDALFTSFTALGANVWALQRRLQTVEVLLEKHGSVTREMIEQYMPTEAEAKQIRDARNAFVAELFDPFQQMGTVAYGASLDVPENPHNPATTAAKK
ncbi:MAG: hypothetical protein SFV21_16675 [Rhodospirillaceae bacterium]|nr:hypothetical protein [Rhodospirillaceae bacterium]